MKFRGYAATEQGKPLVPFEYDPGPLKIDEVDIAVESCGLCHSDLSMLENQWGATLYPLIPGHEAIGKVVALGDGVNHLKVGQRVGLGWRSRSCMVCDQCFSGNHNRCATPGQNADTVVHRHGAFADKVRCQAAWAFPLPESVDPLTAGPLFCGGITVFSPIVINHVLPTHRVAVVGIGGLGHMAIAFLKAWGCEVTAFSTSASKEAEARSMGAHHFLSTRDPKALESAAGRFDLILVTVNAGLDWDAYVKALRPGGKLHIVGAIAKFEATWFPILVGQKSVGGSPVGGPATMLQMLDFAGRNKIRPIVETFPMSKINEAFEHLKHGNPRYRIVLTQDLK
jgi:uncharacterized zinc-type alcohol dehydrogenase-like protein